MFSDEIRKSLKEVPLFSHLDAMGITSLFELSKISRYPKGNIIFLQGDTGDAFYLILEGEVKVTLSEGDGREHILTFLKKGDFFGEMSIFDDQPRSAGIVTTSDANLLIIHRKAFLNYVTRAPEIMRKFLSILCSRLRKTDEQVGDLALLNVYARIVKALLMLCETAGEKKDEGIFMISQRPTHQDIASMVGATRETVSRVFNELKQKGDIITSGRKLLIRETSLRDYLNTLSVNLY